MFRAILWISFLLCAPACPGQSNYVFRDPLAGGTTGRKSGGEFLPDGGWRATGRNDRLAIDLPYTAGPGSVIELDVRNFNPPAQIDEPENHILGLWEQLYASGGDADRPGMDCFVMYAGKKYQQFKLKYHTRGFARQEATYEPVDQFDPSHTYRFRIEWDEEIFSVSIDGRKFYVQRTPRLDPMDHVNTIHLGSNWRGEDPIGGAGHPALKGPVYSNLRVTYPPTDPRCPSGIRIVDQSPASVTLTWNSPMAGRASRYEIFRNGLKIASAGNAGRFLDARLPEGAYEYEIRAQGRDGVFAPGCRAVRAWVVDALAVAPWGAAWGGPKRLIKPLRGVTASTAAFQARYDEKNFYLQAEINNTAPSNGDRLEVLIDGNNNGGPTLYNERSFDDSDRQFVVTLHSGAIEGLRGKRRLSPGDLPAVSVKRSGNGYWAQMIIPWAQLGLAPRAGMRIGFDMRYYDGGSGQAANILAWSSEHDDPLITSAYGDLVLGGR